MHDVSSVFRLIKSESAEMDQTAAIRAEGIRLYTATAAVVCPPGMPKKTMDHAVSVAWGGYPLWRTRACRLGECGAFSAAAIRQAQQACASFLARHQARAAAAAETESVRQAQLSREHLLKLRSQYAAELRKLDARLAGMDGANL